MKNKTDLENLTREKSAAKRDPMVQIYNKRKLGDGG